MRSIVINMVAAAALMVAGSALATDMPPLAKKYGCVNCHSIDVRMIGPSWMEISKAYNENGLTSIGVPVSEILGSKTPEEWLQLKVSHGGAGTWGMVLMPATDPKDTWQVNMRKLIKELSKGSGSKEDLQKYADYYRCTPCHAIDKQVIGPSWTDISKFYNTNGTTPYKVKASDILRSKTAEEYLEHKISHGGLGNWGMMLMPAIEYRGRSSKTDIEQDEVKLYEETLELVRFILGLAKK